MKLCRFVAVIAVIAAAPLTAQETKPATQSPLLQQGHLNKLRPQLEQIFQFVFDGPRLKHERRNWGTLPKNQPAAVNFGAVPPIENIFNQVRATSGPLSGSGMSVSNRHRETYFTGGALNGRLRTQSDQVRLELEETGGPQRSLEFLDDGHGGFRLLLSSADGDLILLQQGKQGACTVAAVVGGKPFAARGENILALYKQQRQAFDAQVLPALDGLAIALIPSSATPEMKKAVLALLARTPETLEEGKKLLADLDSEKFQTRAKASKLLSERFEVFKDLIEEKLKDSAASQ